MIVALQLSFVPAVPIQRDEVRWYVGTCFHVVRRCGVTLVSSERLCGCALDHLVINTAYRELTAKVLIVRGALLVFANLPRIFFISYLRGAGVV